MKDFITRIAERGLGTAPRVDPQATSRYAPARLPLAESRLPDDVSVRASLPETARVARSNRQEERADKLRVTSHIVADENRGDAAAVQRSHKPPVVHALEKSPSAIEETASTPNVLPSTPAVPHANVRRNEEPEVIASHPVSSFDEATAVDHDVATTHISETPDVSIETVAIRESPRNEASAIAAINETATVAPPEIEKPSRSVLARRTAEPIDADVINESARADFNTTIDDRPEQTPTAAFPRLHDNRQTTRTPIAASRPEPPSSFSHQPPYSGPERSGPEIHVRIGRVEVRAAPPPLTPVEPVSSPTPKVSLAEFLREHNRRRG